MAVVNGVDIAVAYDPTFMTLGREDKFIELSQENGPTNGPLCELYAQLFKRMDLQDEDGIDYPMTAEGLLRIPTLILNPIIQQMREHMRGNLLKKSEA